MCSRPRWSCARTEWPQNGRCLSTAKNHATCFSLGFANRVARFCLGRRRTGKELPFRVPTEPLTAAHCEAIVERGGDPFAEYMVPHAALRLKQGFGRLIRSGTDRGAIVIADSRVVNKAYGATLLRAVPPARRILVHWNEISRQLRDFYAVSD